MKIEEKEVFLGKDGRVFGPFTPAEFDKMFAEGELSRYTWIWNWSGNQWKTLETPPPPLSLADKKGNSPASGKGEGPVVSRIQKDLVDIICYSHRGILSGQMDMITESGCVLEAKQSGAHHGSHSVGPLFTQGSVVKLNLITGDRRKSLEVVAKVARIERKQEAWVYRLRWDRAPDLTLLK